MIRTIIKIDQEKCNGCGLCVTACHEEAIGIIDNKAVLLRDDYCDGLGNCLPACPTEAISFEEREAMAFDEAAVLSNKAGKHAIQTEIQKQHEPLPCGCPGFNAQAFKRKNPSLTQSTPQAQAAAAPAAQGAQQTPTQTIPSQLAQWPVQIQLVPVNTPYFADANLLIAADCAAYAYGNFHNAFMENKVTLIGCPKLDHVNYTEKLTLILRSNTIQSVTVVRMEVPCCSGIASAAKAALMNSGKDIPCQVIRISTDGRLL